MSAVEVFDRHGQPARMKGGGEGRKAPPLAVAAAAAGVAAAPVATVPSSGDAAMTAALSTASGEDGGCCLDRPNHQQRGNGAAPLPPLRSVPSAQTSSIALGLAETGGNGNYDDNGGLELHQASALEDAEAAGLLDTVLDELWGGGFF